MGKFRYTLDVQHVQARQAYIFSVIECLWMWKLYLC